MKITAEQFIRIWQRASSLGEVIKLTGMTKTSACAKAAAYRSKGVPLKRFAKTDYKDWKRLADVARECLPKKDKK